MTAEELLKAPIAQRQPARTEQQLLADDAWHRARFAQDMEAKAAWWSRWRKFRELAP